MSTLEEKKKNPLKDLLNFFLPLDARWETKSLSQLNNFYTRQCLAKLTETEIMLSSKIPEENLKLLSCFDSSCDPKETRLFIFLGNTISFYFILAPGSVFSFRFNSADKRKLQETFREARWEDLKRGEQQCVKKFRLLYLKWSW